jgi:hypothetical protein
MHEAVSAVWKTENRSIENIQVVMSKAIAEYFNTSFLSLNEKRAVIKELIDDLPAVAKALELHFSVKGPIFTERWVKTIFEATYNGRHLAIPIHGKLDAIVESANAVEVFDYKTRKSMSINQIKGQTKNSDGDYFRQLVFYELLLSADPRSRTRKIEPALVFVSPDDKGRCPIISIPIQREDMAALKKQIESLIESVWSGKIGQIRCEKRDCEWCALREAAGSNN